MVRCQNCTGQEESSSLWTKCHQTSRRTGSFIFSKYIKKTTLSEKQTRGLECMSPTQVQVCGGKVSKPGFGGQSGGLASLHEKGASALWWRPDEPHLKRGAALWSVCFFLFCFFFFHWSAGYWELSVLDVRGKFNMNRTPQM